jgi:hypothetical protein
MAINFIPNDPLSLASIPLRAQAPRPDRPAGTTGFSVQDPVAEGLFEQGTPDFLFWQCREAALLALETWESLAGPLAEWGIPGPDRKILPVFPNDGFDLNAYYDRESLRFFEDNTDGKSTFSGASTDVVTHETGHALLDAVRPELMNRIQGGANPLPEINAFHESFGDCVALLTALSDSDTRAALLTVSPDLGAPSFVEALMEDLADGILRAFGPDNASSQPRRALNNFKWTLPTLLPTSGPPAVLSGEEHSFSRVFTGCFYDTVRNIFNGQQDRTEAGLLAAAQTAGKLLIAAASKAPETARFFQSVGRAMVLEDQTRNGGAHRDAIGRAFGGHGVRLGSAAMTSPRAALAGGAPRLAAAAAEVLSPATRRDLRDRMGIPSGSRMVVNTLELGGESLAKAVYHRAVSLTGLAAGLEGVVAMAPEPVLVGAVGGRAALLSALPEPSTTEDEVRSYVSTLVAADRIDLPEGRRRTARGAVAASAPGALPTHEVQTRGDQKVLVRVRFICGRH